MIITGWNITLGILSHLAIMIGSILLFRRRKTIPLFFMVVASASALVTESLAVATYLEVMSGSWIYYLMTGLPLSVSQIAWLLFGAGLLGFAVSESRNSPVCG